MKIKKHVIYMMAITLFSHAASTVVLIDASGSMADQKDNVLRSIQWLHKKIKRFDAYGFNDFVFPIKDTISFSGSTDMTQAFQKAKNDGAKVIFLVSDGLPNNANTAMSIASLLKNNNQSKICSIYIGDEKDNGHTFLKRISNEVVVVSSLSKEAFSYCLQHARQKGWGVPFVDENVTVSLPNMSDDTPGQEVVSESLPTMQ